MSFLDVRALRIPGCSETLFGLIKKHNLLQNAYLFLICSFFILQTFEHRLFYYVLLIPLFLVSVHWSRVKQLIQLPVWKYSAIFLGYLWLTQFWSSQPSILAFANGTRILLLLLIFITITLYLAIEDPGFSRRLLKYFAWCGAAAAAASIAYHLVTDPTLSARLIGPGRADHPIIGATLFGLAAIGLYYQVITGEKRTSIKTLSWLALIVLASAVILTESRGPMIGLAVVLSFHLAATRKWKWLALGFCVALACLALYWSGLVELGQWEKRGSAHRLEIWHESWDLITADLRRLIVGYGADTEFRFALPGDRYVTSPHNIFLGHQLYGGLIATALFFWLLASLGRHSLRYFRETGDLTLAAMLVFGLSVGIFDYRTVALNVSQEWLSFWLPLILASAWASQQKRIPTDSRGKELDPQGAR